MQLGEFILKRAEMLTENDLKLCLEAFKEDSIHLESFEKITCNNLDNLSVEVTSDILYSYAKERRGSNSFLNELISKIEL